jgi:large subunit ribosomal protein L22
MRYSYAIQEKNENMAFAVGKDLPISTKKAVEICNKLRRRSVTHAKKFLADVIDMTIPVTMTRYNRDVGHRQGHYGPGRFPVKAAKMILAVIENAEANAQNKGLSTHHLIITHICVHNAARPMHYGRKRRKTKRAHVEVVVLEQKKKDSKEENKK